MMGDFNIDLLKSNINPNVDEFLDEMYSNFLKPTINLPTRISDTSKTLIDNIFTSNIFSNICSGNIITNISDHLPQFLFLPEESSNLPNNNSLFYKDWKNANKEAIKSEFDTKDWDSVLHLNNVNNINTSFNLFIKNMNEIINKHTPVKKLSRKQLFHKDKHWITKGIRKAINTRNYYYNKFIKSKNQDQKKYFKNQFKTYRNRIVNLIKVSKNNYYRNYFNNHKNNNRKTWLGIKEIISNNNNKSSTPFSLKIDNNITSNENIISSAFNKHFTTIADKIRCNKRYSFFIIFKSQSWKFIFHKSNNTI